MMDFKGLCVVEVSGESCANCFSMMNVLNNVLKDNEGNDLKFQGKDKVIEYLRNHEDFYNFLVEDLENGVATTINDVKNFFTSKGNENIND